MAKYRAEVIGVARQAVYMYRSTAARPLLVGWLYPVIRSQREHSPTNILRLWYVPMYIESFVFRWESAVICQLRSSLHKLPCLQRARKLGNEAHFSIQ